MTTVGFGQELVVATSWIDPITSAVVFGTELTGGPDGTVYFPDVFAVDGTVIDGGGVTLDPSGEAIGTTVEDGGDLFANDGIADDTTLDGDSREEVGGGVGPEPAVASNTTIGGGATQNVVAGGIAENTTIVDGDQAIGGGSAIDTTIGDGGIQSIADGGSAISATVGSGGSQAVGGVDGLPALVSDTTVQGGGTQSLYVGGSAIDTILEGSAGGSGLAYSSTGAGEEVVTSSATAISTTVLAGGLMVMAGGTAADTVVSSGGVLMLAPGGDLSDTTVLAGGRIIVGAGGTLDSTTTIGGIAGGMIAGGVIVAVGAVGTATGLTIGDGGFAVLSGGAAIGTTVISGGSLVLSAGGFATETTIGPGGFETVSNGDTDFGTTIDSGGTLAISPGGTEGGATVSSGGTEIIETEGSVSNTSLGSGGVLDLAYLPYVQGGSATLDPSTNLLTISEGGESSTLQLRGSYAGLFFGINNDGTGGIDVTTSAASLLIPVADDSETATIALTENSSDSINSSPRPGTIPFTDTDPSTLPTGTILSQTASVTDGSGNDLTSDFTAGDIASLGSDFQIAPATGNDNDGAIDWTYNPQGTALDFLPAGDTAVIASTVQISDQDGNTDTATVTVTLDGATPPPPNTGLLNITLEGGGNWSPPDQNGDQSYSGAILIGFDGGPNLLEVIGGTVTVNPNSDTVTFSSGSFTTALVGNFTSPLEHGTFEIDDQTGESSTLPALISNYNFFNLVPISLSNLTLTLEQQDLDIFGILTFNMSAWGQMVQLQGNFTGDNFIELSGNETHFFGTVSGALMVSLGKWELQLMLTIDPDPEPGEPAVTATGTIALPIFGTVKATAEFLTDPLSLDKVDIEYTFPDPGVPIPDTPLVFTGITGSVAGGSDDPSFSGGLTFDLGPSNDKLVLATLTLTGTITFGQSGTTTFAQSASVGMKGNLLQFGELDFLNSVGGNLGTYTGIGAVEFSTQGVTELSGTVSVNLLSGLFFGTAALSVTANSFSLSGTGAINIPGPISIFNHQLSLPTWLSGKTLANGTVAVSYTSGVPLSDDFLVIGGSLLGFGTVSLRIGFDQTVELNLPTGSFTGSGLLNLLMTNSITGALFVGQLSGDPTMTYTQIGGLGPEWQVAGDGSFLGDGNQGFLIWDGSPSSPIFGTIVVGEDVNGAAQYTGIGAIGPEWQFEGTGPLLGQPSDDFLLWNSNTGAIVVGAVANGAAQYTGVGAVGPEWQFQGVGDYLGDGNDGFMMWDTNKASSGYGAVAIGEIVNGAAQYTLIGGLDPSVWQFKGTGDLLGHGQDDFMIWDGNSHDANYGALVVGEMVQGAAQYTLVGALGPEWQFLGVGDYDGASSSEFLMRDGINGVLVIGTVANGTATYAAVGGVGSEWNFHATNIATLA